MEETNKKTYTVPMALVDFMPVIAFFITGILIFLKTNSIIYLIGIILSFIGGLCKASWKLRMAIKNHNIPLLTKLFHILLPAGFTIMLVGIVFDYNSFKDLLALIIKMPSLIFLIIAVVGMALMVVFAITLDKNKSKTNWIEQITNTIAQIFFGIAVILI